MVRFQNERGASEILLAVEYCINFTVSELAIEIDSSRTPLGKHFGCLGGSTKSVNRDRGNILRPEGEGRTSAVELVVSAFFRGAFDPIVIGCCSNLLAGQRGVYPDRENVMNKYVPG